MNQALWTAVIAASAAIIAAALTQLFTFRREVNLWKRRQFDKVWELRVALYVELAGYCQRRLRALQESLDGADWAGPIDEKTPAGFGGFRGLEDGEQRNLFLARTDLLGPDSVAAAFRRLYETELLVEWALENDGVETKITDYGAPYLPPDNEHVVNLQRQLTELTAALRSAMRDGQ